MAYPQYFIHFEDDFENKEYICQLCFYIKGTLRAVEKDEIRLPMITKLKSKFHWGLGYTVVEPTLQSVTSLPSEEYLQLYQKAFDIFMQRVERMMSKPISIVKIK